MAPRLTIPAEHRAGLGEGPVGHRDGLGAVEVAVDDISRRLAQVHPDARHLRAHEHVLDQALHVDGRTVADVLGPRVEPADSRPRRRYSATISAMQPCSFFPAPLAAMAPIPAAAIESAPSAIDARPIVMYTMLVRWSTHRHPFPGPSPSSPESGETLVSLTRYFLHVLVLSGDEAEALGLFEGGPGTRRSAMGHLARALD